MYHFAEIRRDATAADVDAMLGANTLGVEITDAGIAANCGLGNIDPQHGRGFPGSWLPGVFSGGAAIDAAAQLAPTLPDGATLITSRADLDSVAAMAMLTHPGLRGCLLVGAAMPDEQAIAVAQRVKAISDADCFVIGAASWEPRPLPTLADPWGDAAGAIDSRRDLAAINAAVQDASVPLATRVEWAARWLLSGEEPECDCGCGGHGCEPGVPCCTTDVRPTYRRRVEDARLALAAEAHATIGSFAPVPAYRVATLWQWRAVQLAADIAVEGEQGGGLNGLIGRARAADIMRLIESAAGRAWAAGYGAGREEVRGPVAQGAPPVLAVVETDHPGATGLGYCLAPVVVCRRPSDGKITIASWGRRYDHAALVAALNVVEREAGGAPSWGGNPASGIIGSPMREGTKLALATIVDLVDAAVEAAR